VRGKVLECRGLRKAFAGERRFELGGQDGGLSFDAQGGELFALLGPSGCGKTTTLRIIGGFTPADSGTVIINGVDVTGHPPHARPTNTVFQSYALFPHLSVGANVAFGLTMERMPRREKRTRVAEVLGLVGLRGFERRQVAELSGGQQQRAALARAIAKRPAVLLLDEPLGALDLKLRKEMQDELARLKTSTSTTFVHVTHDQEEACAIADRIGVMRDGALVQVDRPFALYRNPRDTYVARFLDAGTIVRGHNVRHGDVIEIVHAGVGIRATAPAPERPASSTLAAVIPVDRVRLTSAHDPVGTNRTTGTVVRMVFTGSHFLAYVAVGMGLEVRASLTVDEANNGNHTVGTRTGVTWNPADVLLVDDVG
jgi:ABC-type Fe3+/spermidine/putrescine transport system ATPase subunit